MCAVKLPTHQPPRTFTEARQSHVSQEEVQEITVSATTVQIQVIEIHLTHLYRLRDEPNRWLRICPVFIYSLCVSLLANY